MLKKKSLARKLLECKIRKRQQSISQRSESQTSRILWECLHAEVENNQIPVGTKMTTSFESESRSKAEDDAIVAFSHVDKDNEQGLSISLDLADHPPSSPQEETQLRKRRRPHTKEKQSLNKAGRPEESFEPKSTIVEFNDRSIEYKVIRRRSKSKKVTKSFCHLSSSRKTSVRRMSCIGKRQESLKLKQPFQLPPSRKLHELRAAIDEYTFTRKRSLNFEDQDAELIDAMKGYVPRAVKIEESKCTKIVLESKRNKMVFPCFPDSEVHNFHLDKFANLLQIHHQDEDCDSTSDHIEKAMNRAVKNLEGEIKKIQARAAKSPQAFARPPAPPPKVIDESQPQPYKDGWVIIKGKDESQIKPGLLDENLEVKTAYAILLEKSKTRAARNTTAELPQICAETEMDLDRGKNLSLSSVSQPK